MTPKEEMKGTIRLNSFEELKEIAEEFKDGLISPGGAAARLGVTRAYIHQLEKAGKIRAFRLEGEEVRKQDFPFWIRLLLLGSKMPKGEYIYIPIKDLDALDEDRAERKKEFLRDEHRRWMLNNGENQIKNLEEKKKEFNDDPEMVKLLGEAQNRLIKELRIARGEITEKDIPLSNAKRKWILKHRTELEKQKKLIEDYEKKHGPIEDFDPSEKLKILHIKELIELLDRIAGESR